MSSRRLEKVARSIQAMVGQVIQNNLSDPRIQGMVTVTRVDPAPDLRSARVYLSVLGVSEQQQQLSLRGICHARGHIQNCLARQMTLKTCPTLQFFLDESLKKGYQLVRLIDQVAAETQEHDRRTEQPQPEAIAETEDERQQ